MNFTQMNIPVQLLFNGAWAEHPAAKHFRENSEYPLIAIDGSTAYVVGDRGAVQMVPLNFLKVVAVNRQAEMPAPHAAPEGKARPQATTETPAAPVAEKSRRKPALAAVGADPDAL